MSKQITDQVYGSQADQSTNMPVLTFNLLISYSHIGNYIHCQHTKESLCVSKTHLGLLLQFCSLDAMFTYL